ncbi:hypothetical protein HID58_046915, partial [Brassica napus]
VPRVLSLKISKTGRRDSYSWSFTSSGNYTVRSGYATVRKLLMRYKTKELHYNRKRDKYQTVNGDVKLMHPGRTRTKKPAG